MKRLLCNSAFQILAAVAEKAQLLVADRVKEYTNVHRLMKRTPCLGDGGSREPTADVTVLSTEDEVLVASSTVRRKKGCCSAYKGVIRIRWSYSSIRSTRSLNLR